MSVRRRQAMVLLVCAVMAGTAGCSGSGSAPSASAGASAGGTGRGAPTQEQASRVLQQFLDSWRADGQPTATQRYLAGNQQLDPGGATLVLSAGKVAKVRSGPAGTGGALVLDVDLDLTFTGASGTWRNGINERFVTFTPRDGAVPYAMSFAAPA